MDGTAERDADNVRGDIRTTGSPSLFPPPSSSNFSSKNRFLAFFEGERVIAVVEDDDDDDVGNLLPVCGISGLTDLDLIDRRTDCTRILPLPTLIPPLAKSQKQKRKSH